MKKHIFLFILLIMMAKDSFAVPITSFTEDTSPTSDDLIVTVNNPGGAAGNRKVSLANLATFIHLSDSTSGDLSSTDIDTSLEIKTIVTDETGSGALVFGTSPSFTTPNIGTATGSVSGNAGTATALAANPTNCSAGNYPLGVDASGNVESCTAASAGGLASTDIDTSAEIAAIVTNETGTGLLVFATSPVFTTPNIGVATGSVSGNAGTATALAANGTNASSGNAILGVDASGNAEGSFDVATQSELDAVISDTAYDATSWDADTTHAPSKNAVRDKIEAISAAAGAPTDATYITQTANSSLSAEQALSSLSTGIMRVATTTGAITALTDSAGIAANISDETGTGVIVLATTPTLVTPVLGAATGTSLALSGAIGQLGGSAGISLSAAAGVLTIADLGNTTENLTLNLATSNSATISSGTGVTALIWGVETFNKALGSSTFGVDVLSSSASAFNARGMNSDVTMTSNTATVQAWGGNFVGTKGGTTGGNTLTAIGLKGLARYSSTGTQADAIGIYGDCQKITSASGAITNCYSLYGEIPSAAGGGTITNGFSAGLPGNVLLGGTTGIKLSAATGKITWTSFGNTNNEDLSLDLETTANSALITSSTGVTKLNLGTIAMAAGDYYSGDGTQGATTTCTIVGLTSITVKDGLITSCT